MQASIETALRKFISDNFMYRENIESLADTDSFMDKNLIDSTGVLELVFFLEKTFEIKVADEEVMPDNLDSIKKITAYVQRKQWAQKPLPPLGVNVSDATPQTASVKCTAQ